MHLRKAVRFSFSAVLLPCAVNSSGCGTGPLADVPRVNHLH
jgi:hypothetical protein